MKKIITEVKVKRRYIDKDGFSYGKATGFMEKLSGQEYEGGKGILSEIGITKKVLNIYYHNQGIRATGVLFHEFYHADDYFSGYDAYICNMFGDIDGGLWLETLIHAKVFNQFGTQQSEYFRYLKEFTKVFFLY
jgi:hypothetical protein